MNDSKEIKESPRWKLGKPGRFLVTPEKAWENIDRIVMLDTVKVNNQAVAPEPQSLTNEQSEALEKRDKFFIKYGIELGLVAAATEQEPIITEDRVNQVYQARMRSSLSHRIKL